MKKLSLLLLIGLMFAVVSASASPFRSQSLNGATGLISTPTAHTGWANSSFGVDVGFSYLNSDEADTDTTILKATIQFLNNFEAGLAYDMQEKYEGYNNEDVLIHGKWKFHQDKTTALAVGGNLQLLQSPRFGPDYESWNAGQIYIVATYAADFFGMPSETSMVIGKSFGSNDYGKKNIDFSMGFDLDLLPSIFKGHVRWISDFANYSYSADPINVDPHRGIFNTGARIAILKDSKYKFNVDVLFTDLLDRNRDWGLRACFGTKF
jgi:hypothetical protein